MIRMCCSLLLVSAQLATVASAVRPSRRDCDRTSRPAGSFCLTEDRSLGWQPTGDAKWTGRRRRDRHQGREVRLADDDGRMDEFRAARRVSSTCRRRTAACFCGSALEPKDPTQGLHRAEHRAARTIHFPPARCGRRRIAPNRAARPEHVIGRPHPMASRRRDRCCGCERHAFDVSSRCSQLSLTDSILTCDARVQPIRHHDSAPRHIGLQSKEGEVAFRNVRDPPIGRHVIECLALPATHGRTTMGGTCLVKSGGAGLFEFD